MISKSNTRILVALYHDYHLFGYFEHLIPLLLEEGYKITLLTCDVSVNDQYKKYNTCANFTLNYFPALRVLLRLMEYAPLRPLIWIFGWGWSLYKTRFVDIVIVPRDSKPFQHLISYWKPSLVCQPGLATDDKHYLRYIHGSNKKFPLPQVKTKFKKIDGFFGGSYLSPIRGKKTKKFYSVVGEDFIKFYSEIGAIPSHVIVSGNPNYEGVSTFSMSQDDKKKLIVDLGVKSNQPLYVFFASQLHFTENELHALKITIEKIVRETRCSTILIKAHPRMNSQEKIELENWASSIGSADVKIITHLIGEENNMRLIHIADTVLIEDSNVGILAAWLDKPLMIINLSNKKSENIYSLYDGIIDVSDAKNISSALKKIENHESLAQIIESQHHMLEKISSRFKSPNQKIIEILEYIRTGDKN